MASAFTHTAVALAAGRIGAAGPMPARYWVGAVVLSVLPDADTLAFSFGIPYSHPLGHRGFFHSIPFAVGLAALATWLLFRSDRGRVFLVWAVVGASHGVLDAATDGGLGIALFAPFSDARHFLPVRPLEVSPIGIGAFFGEWGLRVLASEIVWIWTPLALLLLLAEAVRRRPG